MMLVVTMDDQHRSSCRTFRTRQLPRQRGAAPRRTVEHCHTVHKGRESIPELVVVFGRPEQFVVTVELDDLAAMMVEQLDDDL